MKTILALALAVVFAFAAFSQDQSPEVQPADGFYYKTPDGYKKLDQVMIAGGGATHVAKMFVPGLTPQMVYTFRGPEAPFQITDKRPTFYVKELPTLAGIPGHGERDLVILRLEEKKDHRELQISNGGNMFTYKAGVGKNKMPDITVKTIAEGVFTVVPTEDLKPGQYMIAFGSLASSGFDFGIK